MPRTQASEERPVYLAEEDPSGVDKYMVSVDEGWRISVVCSGVYGWAADWLVEQLQGKPYAPGLRP